MAKRASGESTKEETLPQSTPVLDDGLNVSYWKFWRRRRYVVAIMICCGLTSMMCLRDAMGVTIIAMTTPGKGTTLEWDSEIQGLILGGYYYGYISTHILGAWLAGRVGAFHILGVGVGTSGLLNLLIPTLSTMNPYTVLAIRVLQGICHGGCLPCMLMLWSYWTPPLERNTLAAIGYSGIYIGSLLVMSVSGFLAQYTHWSAVFYLFGGLAVLWYVAWVLLVRQRPELDPYMDPRELQYLQKTVTPYVKNITYPWTKFLTSLPVWAVILTMVCQNWGYFTLLTQMPLYISEVLSFDIQKTGFFSALPYIVVSITSPVAGHLSDWLMNKNILGPTQFRKLICCVSMVIQSLFSALPAVVSSPVAAVTSLSLVVGFEGFAMSVLFTNYLDISPYHAGILFGMQCTVTTIPGIISPTIMGQLVKNKTAEEWHIVFFITSGLYMLGALLYLLLGSAEEQSWSSQEEKDKK